MAKEKVRINELGSEDCEDPELREIINEAARAINRSIEVKEEHEEGKISLTEFSRLLKENQECYREINRKMREYKRRLKAQRAGQRKRSE